MILKRDEELQNGMLNLLLVDDSEDDTYMVQEAFEGVQTVTILGILRDGEEALAYLRQQGKYKDATRPCLVLLDINMPKKNGFEVLLEMKRDAKFSSIPVVMLTTSQREEDIARSYANGACTFISKPVNLEKFKQTAAQFGLYWAGVAKTPSDRNFLRAST